MNFLWGKVFLGYLCLCYLDRAFSQYNETGGQNEKQYHTIALQSQGFFATLDRNMLSIKTIRKLFRHHSALKPIAQEERLHIADTSPKLMHKRIRQINKEFKQTFKLLKRHQNTVTFFGSARIKQDNEHYRAARQLADMIVKETGASIITGGGPGIMEAANHGAADENGISIGMTIQLPHEQVTNSYVNRSIDYYYFFSRKVALSFAARAYIYFPGGFGTLDELFEILTLKQTGRIKPIPIILVGSEFWNPLDLFIKNYLIEKNKTINPEDKDLYIISDDLEKIVEIVRQYEG